MIYLENLTEKHIFSKEITSCTRYLTLLFCETLSNAKPMNHLFTQKINEFLFLVGINRKKKKKRIPFPNTFPICFLSHLKRKNWDFPGGPVAKTCYSSAEGPGLIPGQETRSHRLQGRSKITCVTAKTLCSQINIFFNK